MHQRPKLNAGGIALALLIGVFTGPVLFYAIFGDYWHSTGINVNPLYVEIAAVVMVLLALFNAVRFHNAGAVGAITGAAAGVGELAAAAVPWIAFNRSHQTCAAGQICPYLSQSDLTTFVLTVGIFSIGLGVLAFFSLSLLVSALRR